MKKQQAGAELFQASTTNVDISLRFAIIKNIFFD